MQEGRTVIKKAHAVGNSIVVTIDAGLVRKLGIDEETFFEQTETAGGIFLKARRLV